MVKKVLNWLGRRLWSDLETKQNVWNIFICLSFKILSCSKIGSECAFHLANVMAVMAFSVFLISDHGMNLNLQLSTLYYNSQGMAELLNGKALIMYHDLGCYVL